VKNIFLKKSDIFCSNIKNKFLNKIFFIFSAPQTKSPCNSFAKYFKTGLESSQDETDFCRSTDTPFPSSIKKPNAYANAYALGGYKSFDQFSRNDSVQESSSKNLWGAIGEEVAMKKNKSKDIVREENDSTIKEYSINIDEPRLDEQKDSWLHNELGSEARSAFNSTSSSSSDAEAAEVDNYQRRAGLFSQWM
jgi:hypothetical protein